jgi:hypothetical protein
MSDVPQFQMVTVLKPFDGFESVYQGEDADIPVAFPGDIDLRSEKGIEGFDPQLIRGHKVPMGSRVLLWIPQAIPGYLSVTEVYAYQVVWRLRTTRDYAEAHELRLESEKEAGYHLSRRALGAPADPDNADTTKRFVIPAAVDNILVVQSEPAGITEEQLSNLRSSAIVVRAGIWNPPRLPPPFSSSDNAVVTQGVYPWPDASGSLTGGPIFAPVWLEAAGDEMIILAKRYESDYTGQTWNFETSNEDEGFSAIYGTNNGQRAPIPNVGIYVCTGIGTP